MARPTRQAPYDSRTISRLRGPKRRIRIPTYFKSYCRTFVISNKQILNCKYCFFLDFINYIVSGLVVLGNFVSGKKIVGKKSVGFSYSGKLNNTPSIISGIVLVITARDGTIVSDYSWAVTMPTYIHVLSSSTASSRLQRPVLLS